MIDIDFLLINPPYHRRIGSGIVFPLGLGYIASSAQSAGFKVEVLDCATIIPSLKKKDLLDFEAWLSIALKCFAPNIAVGIGPCTTSAFNSIKILSGVCNTVFDGVPLIFGGPLTAIPSYENIFFNEFNASVVVPGDGEYIIGKLLTAIKHQANLDDLEGITTRSKSAPKTNVISNLDILHRPYRPSSNNTYKPSVRRDLNKYPFATMITSRGCKYNCSFCLSGSLRDKQYHRRSVDSVIEEMKYLADNRGIRSVIFYDDTFFDSKETVNEDAVLFSNHVLRSSMNILWQIEMRPEVFSALSRETAKALYNAGCRQMNIGIEKADNSATRLYGKAFDYDDYMLGYNNVMKGAPQMRLTGTFILGGPGETIQSVMDTINLSKELGLIFAHYYPLEIYPGTKLYKDIFGDDDPKWWIDKIKSDNLPWGEIIYEDGQLSGADILSLVKLAYKTFYNDAHCKQLVERYKVIHPNDIGLLHQWSEDRFNIEDGKKV